MGDYNPYQPYVVGNEWVPIQQPSVKLQRNVNNQEYGVGFSLDQAVSVKEAQFYTGQDKASAAATTYNVVSVYPEGQEALSGPIRKVVIPVRSASVTGVNYDVIDNITNSFCQNGSTISGPGCVLQNVLAGYGNITFGYTGNPGNLIQRMALAFFVNDFEAELTGKRILNVSLLHRGAAFAEAADSNGLSNITVPLQKAPGDTAPITFTQIKDAPGASATVLQLTGPTASASFYSPLGTGSLTLTNTFPDPNSNLLVENTESLNLGDVTQLWSFPIANDLNYLPWTFEALSQFDDRSSSRRWIQLGTQIPQFLDGGAVSGTGRVRISYVALEVTYCEETRVAVGGRRTIHEPHEVVTQATSTMHTLPLHVPFSYLTTPVPIAAGNYTLTVSSVNPGQISFAPLDVEYPKLSTTRPLNELPSHPMTSITIPFPLDDTAVGKTFTKQDSTNGVMLSLLDQNNIIRPETHVYGRQVPGLVYGDFTVTEIIEGVPLGGAEFPWIRFWARRFGDTSIPLTVSCSGSSASITPAEFDSLTRLTSEGWKEITLGLEPPVGLLPGGLLLPGTAGSYASTPDDAALDITGDIDLRAEVTVNVFPPPGSTFYTILGKYTTTGNLRSYRLGIDASGKMQFGWSVTGGSPVAILSTVAIPMVSGQRIALRATFDVDNGAGGNTARFYISDSIDGTWVQLGSEVVNSGTTSIFNSPVALEVGGHTNGTGDLWSGIVHAAQVRSGIDGTIVANPDFTAQAPGTTSFADSAGRTWAVNGNASIVADGDAEIAIVLNTSGNTRNLLVTWSSTGQLAGNRWEILGSNAASVSGYVQNNIPLYYSTSPATYGAGINSSWGLVLPGTAGSYASTPDTAALDITGDIDIRVEATLDDWASAGFKALVAKWNDTGNQRSYVLQLSSSQLQFVWSNDGTAVIFGAVTAPTGGGRKAVRATLDADNGAGGRTLTFYTAPTIAGPWTQLGAPVVQAGVTSIFSGTALGEVGAHSGGTFGVWQGTVHAAEVRNGINGTVVANPDFTAQAPGTPSFADSAGRTWVVNGNAYIGSTAFEGTSVTLLNNDPDIAVFFSQEVPPVTGFTLTPATQTLTGIGADCGDAPCCVPSELYYHRLTWDLPEGTNYVFQDLFDRTEVDGWGLPEIYTVPPSGLWLPGTAGSYASTPDNAVLDITGDIDLRADVDLSNFVTTATQVLVGKYNNTGNQRSYRLGIQQNTGQIELVWSTDGITPIVRQSTVALPVGSGRLAVRATLDVNNGAAGHTVTFYTAPTISGSWTQLGTPIVTAGVTSIFSGTAAVEVGTSGGGTSLMATGLVFAAEVRNGINGTIVTNPDFAAEPANTTSFTDAAGRAWTVNGSATINSSDAFSVANGRGYINTNLGPSPILIDDIGYNYDLSVILRQEQAAAARASFIGRDRYVFDVVTGSSSTSYELWLELPNGSFMRIRDIEIAGGPFTQGIYSSVYVRYLLDGAKWKVKAWPEIIEQPDIWTAEVDVAELNGLVLPGTAGSYASTPDTAALDITGDLDIRADITMRVTGGNCAVVSKFLPTGNQVSYMLSIGGTGQIRLLWSPDGTLGSLLVSLSSVPVPAVVTGQRGAIRATIDVNNGSGGKTVTYYTAPTIDGSWTQLGTPDTTAGTTSIFSGSALLEIGSHSGGTTNFWPGVAHAAEVRNGINGTVVADVRFDEQADGDTSFVDSTGLTWTVNEFAYIINDEAVATNSDIELKLSDSAHLSYQNLVVTPPQYWFGNYEIQRRDEVETEWKTILQATSPALTGFNDYEARPGIISDYRIRRANVYDFPSEWSPVVTGMIPAPGVVSNECLEGGHLLLFTSNERQDGSVNLAYSSVWMERQVDENFTFPEAGFVELQPMYDRDFYIAFRPLERGGEQFSRTILVQAAAIPPETLADFTSLRDMAWEDVNYVCVRDEDGNRWLATVQVPNGNVLRNRRLYLATVNIAEVTDTPTPVDPSPWS